MNLTVDGTTLMAIPPDIWNYVRFILFCVCVSYIWKGCRAVFKAATDSVDSVYDDMQKHNDSIEKNYKKQSPKKT